MLTKEILLKDINKDVRFPLGNRYFLKRYKYHKELKGCWVDKNDKKITERVFSFIIEHGVKWDNSTHFNLLESELDTLMDVAMVHLNRIKAERKELLTSERAERKLYPQLIQYEFKNVTISVVSKMLYTQCGYPIIGKKNVNVYGNGLPFEHSHIELDKDDNVLTYDFIMEHIINRKVMKHTCLPNVENKLKFFNSDVFVKKSKITIDKSFVPLHFYIGYCIEINDIQYNVTDAFDSYYRGFGFNTDKGEIQITLDQLLNLKVVGELNGMNGWCSLLNKMKYV